jgi:hypothetical protein
MIVDEYVLKEFQKWQQNNNKLEYKKCYISKFDKDGQYLKTDLEMALVSNNSNEDWKEFCIATNKEYKENIKLSIQPNTI